MLQSDFRDFLGSFKNAESLSPELQAAIAVDTGLEAVVRTALSDGRCVIVAGSAGSGKTHLVRAAVRLLGDSCAIVSPGSRPRGPHVLVVEDATELDVEERLKATVSSSGSRVATLIAINEGPLVEAARADRDSQLAKALGYLHLGRRGLLPEGNTDAPTVIDMGAFNPLDPVVISRILDLPLLRETVENSSCDCEREDCPRRLGWQQLEAPEVRDRLGVLLGCVHVLEQEWLFRDLWDFIADIALGGSCSDGPPTSPWFWRVFYGDSRLSVSLRGLVSPDDFPLPRIDARIFYGDWGSEFLAERVPGTRFVFESQGLNAEKTFAPFRYMKAQALFLLKDVDVGQRSIKVAGGTVENLVLHRNVSSILQAINHYFVFGFRPGSETVLDLFVEHDVERRSQHIDGVIKLGEADAGDFDLRLPQVVMNHPDALTTEGAGFLYLVHRNSAASLRVDGGRIRLLQRGRTIRVSDRAQVDLDWDLCQFFERILRLCAWKNNFSVVRCDFRQLRADERKYRASAIPAILEEA